MTSTGTSDPLATHEVLNQPPPLSEYDVYTADTVLRTAVAREGAGWADQELRSLGQLAGSPEAQLWGEQANANPPVLQTHDRYGHRVDRVEYHPAYHELMRTAIANGLHSAPWDPGAREGAHVARAAKMIVWSQVDAGHTCPISMTYSVLPALRHQPDVAADWEPSILSTVYDSSFVPHERKTGVTCGMGMTEKQGGSDVRANSTRAEPTGGSGPGGEYLLTGHKWFCSAPMSDGFLMLAYTDVGLSCFLVPRWLPDGTPNVFRIQRLKDKLGDRSNASSEIELAGTWARMVGEEGHGVRTIIEMVNHTRLDCTLGSAAIFRKGTAEAIHHAEHRDAFGGRLVDKPLMANVLADLAVESEAATTSAIWLAALFDRAGRDEPDERAVALRRIATPVLKYWACKRAPVHAAEALECLGGAGYVEESGLPRLFRQSPVNGVWEGSGNVICLDVLRAMARNPEAIEVLFDELASTAGLDRRLDHAIGRIEKDLADPSNLEARARRVVEQLALTLQASLLVRDGDPAAAEAFCASRLGGDGGLAFGTLPRHTDTTAIIGRHRPG
ncbi:MAG: acyl-CoA dehydrogenase family protein [Actinobacteria bacterium]|nr:acyl-CoA dehydrogenase family protein [Actinomycetota bacterium]